MRAPPISAELAASIVRVYRHAPHMTITAVAKLFGVSRSVARRAVRKAGA